MTARPSGGLLHFKSPAYKSLERVGGFHRPMIKAMAIRN